MIRDSRYEFLDTGFGILEIRDYSLIKIAFINLKNTNNELQKFRHLQNGF